MQLSQEAGGFSSPDSNYFPTSEQSLPLRRTNSCTISPRLSLHVPLSLSPRSSQPPYLSHHSPLPSPPNWSLPPPLRAGPAPHLVLDELLRPGVALTQTRDGPGREAVTAQLGFIPDGARGLSFFPGLARARGRSLRSRRRHLRAGDDPTGSGSSAFSGLNHNGKHRD
jgi:hypothetical protein